LNILKVLTILFLIFLLVKFCSAAMASKKDRGIGKLINQPLTIKSESSPIVSPVTTSMALTNSFMTFSP